jgi:hypothetical protein
MEAEESSSSSRTPAWDAWSSLTDAEKKEVDRFARMGQRHPDPRVAAAADGWARVVLSGEPTVRGPWFARLGSAAFELLDFVSAPPGETWFERRWARRVRAAE